MCAGIVFDVVQCVFLDTQMCAGLVVCWGVACWGVGWWRGVWWRMVGWGGVVCWGVAWWGGAVCLVDSGLVESGLVRSGLLRNGLLTLALLTLVAKRSYPGGADNNGQLMSSRPLAKHLLCAFFYHMFGFNFRKNLSAWEVSWTHPEHGYLGNPSHNLQTNTAIDQMNQDLIALKVRRLIAMWSIWQSVILHFMATQTGRLSQAMDISLGK